MPRFFRAAQGTAPLGRDTKASPNVSPISQAKGDAHLTTAVENSPRRVAETTVVPISS